MNLQQYRETARRRRLPAVDISRHIRIDELLQLLAVAVVVASVSSLSILLIRLSLLK